MLNCLITWGAAILLALSFFVYILLVVGQEQLSPRSTPWAYPKKARVTIVVAMIAVILAAVSAVTIRLVELS